VNRRLLLVGFVVIAATCASIAVWACSDKTTSASNTSAVTAATASSNGACTAAMAAKCTAQMAAACKAKGAAATMAQCPYHNSSAAMTAESNGACSHHASASATASAAVITGCSGSKTSAAAAGMGSCSDKAGAVGTGACAGHKGAAAAFEAMLQAGGSCSGRGAGVTAGYAFTGHNCDACQDMALCESQLKAAGSSFQVVPLKNGVMYVYTAGDPKNVRAVQAAIARRNERMNALLAADNAKLCPDCKQVRGAIASGKLTREVVNIEGGSFSLVSSNDPAMVARLCGFAGLPPQQKCLKS